MPTKQANRETGPDQTGPEQSRVENLKWTWGGLGPKRCQFYGQTRNFHPSLSPVNGVGAVLCVCVYVCVCVNEAKTKDTREKWPTIWH